MAGLQTFLFYLPLVLQLRWTARVAAEAPPTVTIGGIFTNRNTMEEDALRFAAKFINTRRDILPDTTLTVVTNYTEVFQTFQCMQSACYLAEQGAAVIVGPRSSTSVKTVNNVCSGLHIPHIAPVATDPLLGNQRMYPYLLRMSSPDTEQSRALIALVKHFGWTRMCILTSLNDYGMNGVVEFQSVAASYNWDVVSVQQFQVNSDPSKIDVRLQLQKIKGTGVRVIILNCLAIHGMRVLEQAGKMGLTWRGWAWIVTDGFTGMAEVTAKKPIPHYLQGLVGTRPAPGRGGLYEEFLQAWISSPEYSGYPRDGEGLEQYPGLFADAVFTFAYGLDAMIKNRSEVVPGGLGCRAVPAQTWESGETIMGFMKKIDKDGVMKRLRFSPEGKPAFAIYDFVNLGEDGWRKVGSWSKEKDLQFPLNSTVAFMSGAETVQDFVTDLRNRSLKVVTILEPPFVMEKDVDEHGVKLVGNDRFYGFCIDLLKRLGDDLGFRYEIYVVEDNTFGMKDPITGRANGVIRDLIEKKADLAAASLTISFQREKDIDFTKPYLDLGLTFIMSREKRDDDLFKFLEPFEIRLWIYIAVATVAVALFLALVNRMSPYDHRGRAARKGQVLPPIASQDPPNPMGVANAVWFSIASLFQQGPETYPHSPSGRIIASLWWFVVVIIIATYTAKLAAFLTISRMDHPINSVEALANQIDVAYGTVSNSQPADFFRSSSVKTFQTMAEFIATNALYLDSSAEGIIKSRKEKFAFIWDSAVLDYVANRAPCDLKTVGRLFGKIGYGFGLQKSSPYTDQLSVNILRLRESGFIDALTEKWYHDGSCEPDENVVEEVQGTIVVGHMLGVFCVIYGGMAVSLVVLVGEWVACVLGQKRHNEKMSLPQIFHAQFKKVWRGRKALSASHLRHDGQPCDVRNMGCMNCCVLDPKSANFKCVCVKEQEKERSPKKEIVLEVMAPNGGTDSGKGVAGATSQ
ncbi:glutamate receptor 2-like [Branchiostoma lanceolatum]|uniref:glutamate receptor 2-like n=1 Tax=Branchiostoma lanceolatum TaxID=7740 RepID=UPI003452569F